MANRRMFSLDVVDTDQFLDMPATSQNLYFHLGVRADDDGFVSSPKKITKLVNCGSDDLNVLVSRGYIIPFENGIVVLRHWRQNNYIQSDRYKETIYQNELALLTVSNGIYEFAVDTSCIHPVSKLEAQVRKEKESTDKKSTGNTPPTPSKGDVVYYPEDAKLNQAFCDYVAMRKKIRKPLTQRAVELAMRRLRELSAIPFSDGMDDDLAVEILEQSVLNGWQGLFPLRQDRKNSNRDGSVFEEWRNA